MKLHLISAIACKKLLCVKEMKKVAILHLIAISRDFTYIYARQLGSNSILYSTKCLDYSDGKYRSKI